ncbi:hypothetical protein PTKIN_Ptkin02bG0053400 [Pterospermum kingtungense]
MKEGLIWNVGDGSHIRIWEDVWIPSVPLNKPMGPPTFEFHDLKVWNLIDSGIGHWNIEVIDQMFIEEKVKRIKEIPPSRTGGGDKMVWALTKNQAYTVKSGYHFLQNHEDCTGSREKRTGRDVINIYDLWRKLWNTQLP